MLLFNIYSSYKSIDVIDFTKLDENSINKIFITKIIGNKAKTTIVIIKSLIRFFFYDLTLSTTRWALTVLIIKTIFCLYSNNAFNLICFDKRINIVITL